MSTVKILWADDEIELLKPHILFLEQKGYEVETCLSGDEVLDKLEDFRADIIFLDENMPGLTGLETLELIKKQHSSVPVVMITKSEEESIMDEAIGGKISDYLIKPVNPKQILMAIKKNVHVDQIQSEKATTKYQQAFREIGMRINDRLNIEEWQELYEQMVFWELELQKAQDTGMDEILAMRKAEANLQFSRFIEDNYIDWVNGAEDAPNMSHNVLKNKVFPLVDKNKSSLFLIVIDNLRFDQWKVLKPLISEHFWVEKEETYVSILPTTTQYARNALFAGLMPLEIEQRFPDKWSNDDEEGNKNNYEKVYFSEQLKRFGLENKFQYYKVLNADFGKKVLDDVPRMMQNPINIIIYNFVDMLSHARTDTEIVKQLARDEAAYRSVTVSWYEHSTLQKIIKKIAKQGGRVIITTDHGSVRVKNPVKVVGDKSVNTNLRYKQGKTLNYNPKEVFEITHPKEAHLPQINVSQKFIFAKSDDFFVYPNNYNHYVNYYKDTFQHGGVSLEEMLVPIVALTPKK